MNVISVIRANLSPSKYCAIFDVKYAINAFIKHITIKSGYIELNSKRHKAIMFIDPIFHINESFCILDKVGYGCFSDKHCIAYSMYPSPSLQGVYPNINRISNRYT